MLNTEDDVEGVQNTPLICKERPWDTFNDMGGAGGDISQEE